MSWSVRTPTVLFVVLVALPLLLAPVAPARAAVPQHTFARLASAETTSDDVFEVRGRLTSAPGLRVWLWSRPGGTTTWRKGKGVVSDPRTGAFQIRFRGECGTRFRIAVRETRRWSRTDVYIGRIVCD